MSVKIMALVWHTDFTSTQKLVLLKLADCGDDTGKNIFPAVSTIAKQTGLYERTVRRTLKELRDLKIIRITKHADNKYQKTNIYAIDIKKLNSNPPVTQTPLSEKQEPPVPVTPPPCHSDTQTIKEPSINRKEDIYVRMSEIYNEILGEHLPRVRAGSDSRKTASANRFKDEFKSSYDEWTDYCLRVRDSEFLLGSTGWAASFDWMLKPVNINKVLEGNYVNRDNKSKPKSGVDAMFAGFGSAVDKTRI